MPHLDRDANVLFLKLAYVGPQGAGKSTTLDQVATSIEGAGKTVTDLGIEAVSFSSGEARGLQVQWVLVAAPEEEGDARLAALRGVDGVVFVADADQPRGPAALASFRSLVKSCVEASVDLAKLPFVIQLNKRDLPDAATVDDVRRGLRFGDVPCLETVAIKGTGVVVALKTVMALVLRAAADAVVGPDQPIADEEDRSRAAREQSHLATALLATNDPRAEDVARRALDEWLAVRKASDPEVAFARATVGAILMREGKLAEARAFIEEAVSVVLALKEEHSHMGAALNLLASLDFQEGKLDAARAGFERSLAISRRFLDENHPQIADAKQGLLAIESASLGDA